MEGGACPADDLRQPLQLACGTVGVKACIEPLGNFLQLELERHAMEQEEALGAEFIHLRIHDGAQLGGIGGWWCGEDAHAG